jgi:hypothetical protein
MSGHQQVYQSKVQLAWHRGQIASQLRSKTPLKICLLIAVNDANKDLPE